MKYFDLTLATAAENVALDEALLEAAELGQLKAPILRLWEPTSPMVVLGRSSPAASEAMLDLCDRDQVPVIRRCSGGATILAAPGCLMYAVLLSYQQQPELRMLDKVHQFVVGRLQLATAALDLTTDFQGTCDLTIGNRKCSGNALRCKKNWLIYHGTLICRSMDLGLVSKYLGIPKRQPDYRKQRSHQDFLASLDCDTKQLKDSLRFTWQCNGELADWPDQLTGHLVADKYSCKDWNLKIM